MTAFLSDFLVTMSKNEFQMVSVSDMWNAGAPCQYIDSGWQVFVS